MSHQSQIFHSLIFNIAKTLASILARIYPFHSLRFFFDLGKLTLVLLTQKGNLQEVRLSDVDNKRNKMCWNDDQLLRNIDRFMTRID